MELSNAFLRRAFASLTTAQLASACVRSNVELRAAPTGVGPVHVQHRLAGRVRPIQYAGSLDIILEAIQHAHPGDVLLIDNGGRRDEGCVGHLLVLEAQLAQLGGYFIWGCHRDTAPLANSPVPVFSYGSHPAESRETRVRSPKAFEYAALEDVVIIADDLIFGNQDGVIFVDERDALTVLEAANAIRDQEQRYLKRLHAGLSFRSQINFDLYLEARTYDDAYTFADHLRALDAPSFGE